MMTGERSSLDPFDLLMVPGSSSSGAHSSRIGFGCEIKHCQSPFSSTDPNLRYFFQCAFSDVVRGPRFEVRAR